MGFVDHQNASAFALDPSGNVGPGSAIAFPMTRCFRAIGPKPFCAARRVP